MFRKICAFAFSVTCALFISPAHAKNVDFSSFAASCPQMSAALSSVENQLNKMRLSDKDFLRVQLQSFQNLSRVKTSGSNCSKIKKFFGQQANATRTALRNRAATSNARAAQMTAQLNQFTADMQTLQVVLGAVSEGLSTPTQTGSTNTTNSARTSVPVATKCLKVLDHGWTWGLQNRCSKPIVAAVCYSSPNAADNCKGTRNTVWDGGGFVNFSGGRIRPGEKVLTLTKEGGKLKLAACDASKTREGRSVTLEFGRNLASFQCYF